MRAPDREGPGPYSPGDAQTKVENCGTKLILPCSASEQGGAAKFCSRLIGQREIVRPHVSESHRGEFFLSKVTLNAAGSEGGGFLRVHQNAPAYESIAAAIGTHPCQELDAFQGQTFNPRRR